MSKKAQHPHPHQQHQLSAIPLFIKAICLAFLFVFIFLMITAFGVAVYAYHKTQTFTGPAQTSLSALTQTLIKGWQTIPQQDNGRVNFLILGSDELATRGDEVPLTDTMMVASLNLKTAQVGLYSLPRDIWLPTYQAKINTLHSKSNALYPTDPEKLPREEVEQLTGVPIQHVIVIKLDTLSQLVDLVGGVTVDVKEGFTDPLFPRPDVDVTKVHDPKLLYETVTFASGSTKMNGDDVLKYVRSRHATGDQGSDDARGTRQQDVILALVSMFKDPHFWTNLPRDGALYHFYQTEFNQYLPITELIAIGRQLQPNLKNFSFTEGTPSIYPTDPNGVIYHPTGDASKYYGAWVYEIRDPKLFQAEAQKALHYTP